MHSLLCSISPFHAVIRGLREREGKQASKETPETPDFRETLDLKVR
jgi:hypothetical protein